MGLNVLPCEGLVRGPYVPGPCAWPIARLLKGVVEREDERGHGGGPLNSVCVCAAAAAATRVLLDLIGSYWVYWVLWGGDLRSLPGRNSACGEPPWS